MSEMDEVLQFKILIIGESSVGKSSLMSRFIDDAFQMNFLPTVGMDFKVRTLFIDGYQCKVQVWDTAGQERFHGITTTYYRDAAGVLIVYDVTNGNTFVRLQRWLDVLDRYCRGNIAKVLVGNKDDQQSSNKVISTTDARQYARKMNMSLFETSARDNKNVYEVFYAVTSLALQNRLNKIEKKDGSLKRTIVPLNNSKNKSNSTCCK